MPTEQQVHDLDAQRHRQRELLMALPIPDEARSRLSRSMGQQRAYLGIEIELLAVAGRIVLVRVADVGYSERGREEITGEALVRRMQESIGHDLEGLTVCYFTGREIAPVAHLLQAVESA